MFRPDLEDLTAVREQLRRGGVSAAQLMAMAQERVEALESSVQAFLYLDWERAQKAASQASPDASRPLGGIPLAIKDLMDVEGMPTTGGSKAYRWVAANDAPAVARWRQAGGVIVGKTNTHELAYGVMTPPTHNPWRLDRIPGGSSGGSAAALAAGMVLGAMGSDTGGSIRIPAACCGVVGFKPTYGQVPTDGVIPLSWSLDHVGPLGHSVRDVALLYRLLIQAPNPWAPLHADRPIRVAGIPRRYLDGRLSEAVAMAFRAAEAVFQEAGWVLEDVDMEPWETWRGLFADIRGPEAFVYHQEVLDSDRASLLGPLVRRNLEGSRAVPASTYIRALRSRAQLQEAWRQRMQGLGVLLLPTLPITAPPMGQEHVAVRGQARLIWETLLSLTAPWNILGYPAISVPSGFDEDGLPVGLQIVGVSGADETVLAVASDYVSRTSWHRRQPDWIKM